MAWRLQVMDRRDMLKQNMPKSRLYAIWYACIGLGFLLIGLFRLIRLNGQGTALHFIVAFGFGLLSFVQFRAKQ